MSKGMVFSFSEACDTYRQTQCTAVCTILCHMYSLTRIEDVSIHSTQRWDEINRDECCLFLTLCCLSADHRKLGRS